MNKRRIAILTTHPIQYHTPWFRALAAREELDVEVFFCHRATPEEQSGAGFGVKFAWDIPLLDGYPHRFLQNVARNPTISKFDGLDTPEIKDIIRRGRYDAVIVNGWHFKSAWQAFRACWQTKTPVMARGDSHLHTRRHLLKRALKWPYYRWFIPKLDACLAVGKWSSEYYLHYGARPERIFLVPHVIDDLYFAGASVSLGAERADIRRAWGLDQDKTVFLFAAKFIEKKRPMDFVRAVDEAAAKGAGVMGLMVGDGPLRAACEAFVKAHESPVKFAGFLNQSQVSRAYVAADALVLPSNGGETWGLVVNEAMACGRPCIVSDQVGCGPDMVVPGETGDIFPLGDIAALSRYLAGYAAKRAALEAMSEKARAMAHRYSIDAAVEGVLRAVESVSGGKR